MPPREGHCNTPPSLHCPFYATPACCIYNSPPSLTDPFSGSSPPYFHAHLLLIQLAFRLFFSRFFSFFALRLSLSLTCFGSSLRSLLPRLSSSSSCIFAFHPRPQRRPGPLALAKLPQPLPPPLLSTTTKHTTMTTTSHHHHHQHQHPHLQCPHALDATQVSVSMHPAHRLRLQKANRI